MTDCECKTCCSFPNGRSSIFALLLAIASFLLFSFGLAGCHFIQGSDFVENGAFDFGPVRRENLDQIDSELDPNCAIWHPDDRDYFFDKPLKSAFAFAILAGICVAIGTIILLILACCTAPESMTFSVLLLFLLGSIFQAFGFVAFADDFVEEVNGKFSWGAGIAIIGILTSAATAACAMGIPSSFINGETVRAPASVHPAPEIDSSSPELTQTEGTKAVMGFEDVDL